MSNHKKINDQVTVGPQPSRSEIKTLASNQFKSVINFRTEGEEEQSLSPNDEGDLVEEAGMNYLHIPVSMNSLDESTVDQFREQFQILPKPVFAHCKSGKRAGAMVMMDTAVKSGMTGEQTLAKAEEMGFACDVPELKDFVTSYVDGHGS